MNASERLHQFLSEILTRDYDKEYAEHVLSLDLEWQVRELHQIIWDCGYSGVNDVAHFFQSISELEGRDEIYEMFMRTTEHSH